MSSFASSLIACLARLIMPAGIQQRASLVAQVENLLTAALLALVIMPAFGLLNYAIDDDINALACFIAILGLLIALGMLKMTGSVALARELFILSIFLLIIALTYRLGGISSPTVVWLAVCPLLGSATGGRISGVFWTVLCFLAMICIYLGNVFGWYPAVTLNDTLTLVSFASFLAALAVFGLMYERVTARAFGNLNRALHVIQELAIKDELTSVFNRRELIRLVEQEKSRVQRNGSPFCLCLIDIDHFKQVNDVYGHATGDQVLRRMAEFIQRDIRNTDCFGRYGGEEFLLLLAEANADLAQGLAERIRQGIEEMRFPEFPDAIRITISIGVAEYQHSETIDQTLSRADQALYRAKREGRNRTVVAPAAPCVEQGAGE